MEQVQNFLKESYEELKKVTWLSRKEVFGSTIVIMILILLISIFVTLVDFVCLRFIGWIL